MFLTSEKSQTPRPGPRKIPRAASPRVPHVSAGLFGHGTIGLHMEHIGIESLAWISSDDRVRIVRNSPTSLEPPAL